jgi:hypothetical protein
MFITVARDAVRMLVPSCAEAVNRTNPRGPVLRIGTSVGLAQPGGARSASSPEEVSMGVVAAAVLIGLVLLILGIVVKAVKWLIIIAVVVWLVGLVRGIQMRRRTGGGSGL